MEAKRFANIHLNLWDPLEHKLVDQGEQLDHIGAIVEQKTKNVRF